MRILIPVLGFAAAGGYRVLSELANHWIELGNEVAFLTPDGEAPPYFPTTASILAVSESGAIGPLQAERSEVGFRGVRKLWALWRGLGKVGRYYDVILANHSFTPWAVTFASTGDARAFYYIQAYEPEYFRMEGQSANWLVSRLSYFLPSTQIANTAIYSHHRGVAPVAIVPAGIDLGTYHPKPVRRNFNDGADIVLGCIGRREPAKGTEYVLDAFDRIAALDPRFRLRVAYGNLPAGWTHPRCEIVVPTNDHELAAFYRSVDIMVTAGTVQHGAPHYPVIEAMASGTPVVTTGFMPATADNSWIVANRDADAIVGGIRAIVADADYGSRVDRALGAVQCLSWPVVAAAMLATFGAATPKSR